MWTLRLISIRQPPPIPKADSLSDCERWHRPTKGANQRVGRWSPRMEWRASARRLLLATPNESNQLGWEEGGPWFKQGVLKWWEKVVFRTDVIVVRHVGSTHGVGTCSPWAPWLLREVVDDELLWPSKADHRDAATEQGIRGYATGCYAYVTVVQK